MKNLKLHLNLIKSYKQENVYNDCIIEEYSLHLESKINLKHIMNNGVNGIKLDDKLFDL